MGVREIPAVCLLVLATATTGAATGFDAEPFPLRLSAALTRFSGYGDVAGVGGASAGSPWGTSLNPAAVAWSPSSQVAVSPQATSIDFEEGTRLTVGVVSLTAGSERTGWFLPTLAVVRSNRTTSAQGLEFEFDLQQVQLQWGKRLGEDLTLGATGALAWSETEFGTPAGPLVRSRDRTLGVRAGALYRVTPAWLAGLVAEYGRTRSDAEAATPFGTLDIDDDTRQVLVRPGLSVEYREKSFLYADYQYGRFENDTDTLRVHRAFAGVEHRLTSWLYPRVGSSADDRGRFAWTAGLGLYPSPSFSLDLAYQCDFFPELDPEFGVGRTVALSVSGLL